MTHPELAGLAFDLVALLSAAWLWITSFRRQRQPQPLPDHARY